MLEITKAITALTIVIITPVTKISIIADFNVIIFDVEYMVRLNPAPNNNPKNKPVFAPSPTDVAFVHLLKIWVNK